MSDAQYGLREEYKDHLWGDEKVRWMNIALLWLVAALLVISHVEQAGSVAKSQEIRRTMLWFVPIMVTQPFWGAALRVARDRVMSS